MRNPLWMLNVGITFLFILVLGLIYFTRKTLPQRKSLVPLNTTLSPKKGVSSIDLSRIYENDLFKTYQRPVRKTEPQGVDLTFPKPPTLKNPQPLQAPRVQFLDPLKINIKGIISVGDERDNRVIIEDEKTKKEELYAVGETIEDAEILRIDNLKVIFVRSNGQEETIFLNAQDALVDPFFLNNESWNSVVKKLSNSTFAIDEAAFLKRITNLAEFIDMLDLTAAIVDGASVGVRVGVLPKRSIGAYIGLTYEDIIKSVNGLPVSTTKDRVNAYNAFIKNSSQHEIRVVVNRHGADMELIYVFTSPEKAVEENQPAVASIVDRNPVGEFAGEIPQSFAEIQKQDKMAMQQLGGRASLVQRTNQT